MKRERERRGKKGEKHESRPSLLNWTLRSLFYPSPFCYVGYIFSSFFSCYMIRCVCVCIYEEGGCVGPVYLFHARYVTREFLVTQKVPLIPKNVIIPFWWLSVLSPAQMHHFRQQLRLFTTTRRRVV